MRVALASFLLIVLSLSAYAQEATPEITAEAETLRLRPFTLEIGDVSGAAPADWTELQAGSYLRDDGDADQTYILHISAEGASLADLIDPFLEAYGIESLPESSESHESTLFTWSIHSFDYTPIDTDLVLRVDIGIAEAENRVYVIILQGFPDDNEFLHSEVFIPAMDFFGLPLDVIQEALGYESLSPISLESFGIETVYPLMWQEVNPGSYMRMQDENDLTTVIIQSSPDLEASAFAELLLETIGLPPELPESSESYEGSELTWAIYEIDYQGYKLVLATAEDENLAYLVVMLCSAEEAESLRESLLVPILDATKPIE
jgi:hypothetical protein